jgi:pimeloyl-ACP methyl ester carboxylesterase
MANSFFVGYAVTAHTIEERLVFFPSGTSSLAGILTVPSQPNGRTVLIPWGTSTAPSSGINGVRARLARTLADEGFHSFRFDYPGVGESDGDYRVGQMSSPLVEEIEAACTWLAGQGLERIVIVANCFGGWSGLMAAPKLAGLEGMVIVNPPVRRDHKQVRAADEGWQWWVKRLKRFRFKKVRSAEYRAQSRKLLAAKGSSLAGTGSRDKRFSNAVRHLLDRRIPILVIYGIHDFLADFESELEQGLGAAMEQAGPPTRYVTVPVRLEGFASLDAQAFLLGEVVPWLHSLPSPSA